MKKMIVTLVLAASSLFAVAGEETKVSSQVLNAFNKDFSAATEVNWIVTEDYSRANFLFNGQYVSAFYSAEDGDLMGITRNISSLDLPLQLQAKLKNNYSKFWITDLFEVSNNEGTKYYITVENAENKIVLQSSDYNAWTEYKKTTKS